MEDGQEYAELVRRLERIDSELAAVRATPQPTSSEIASLIAGTATINAPHRSILAEHMLCMATESLAGRGDPQAPNALARLKKTQAWVEFNEMRQLAMSTADATAGGAMVQETLSQDLIEALRAASAISRLNPQSIQMPTGSATKVKITTGAVAYYVGEGKPATVSQLKTGRVNLSFHKLQCYVPVSNDLIRFALTGSLAKIQRDAVNAIRTRGDLALMRGDGLNDTPVGLLNLAAAANKFASAGTTQANIIADFAKAHQKLAEANIPMNMLGCIMSPRSFYYAQSLITTNGVKAFPSLSEGSINASNRDGLPKMEGDPVAVSSQVPNNLYTSSNKSDVIVADFDFVTVGEALSLQVAVSQDGSYTDAAGTKQNAFENDETLLRLTVEHDINVDYPEAVVVIHTVPWTN